MSRIGKKLIPIPDSTVIAQDANVLVIQGAKGTLSLTIHPKALVTVSDKVIAIGRHGDDRLARSIHGLTQVLVANAVEGVTNGFAKKVEMHGIGYRAESHGSTLTLTVGFTHPVVIEAPDGISFIVEKGNIITISGIDKQLVGQVAANIRSVRKPEPYKGKGIRYQGEIVRRKAGKAAKTGK